MSRAACLGAAAHARIDVTCTHAQHPCRFKTKVAVVPPGSRLHRQGHRQGLVAWRGKQKREETTYAAVVGKECVGAKKANTYMKGTCAEAGSY